MEDRKNYLKQSYINNSNQLIKLANNSQTHQQQQQQHIQSLKQIQDMNNQKFGKLKPFYSYLFITENRSFLASDIL